MFHICSPNKITYLTSVSEILLRYKNVFKQSISYRQLLSRSNDKHVTRLFKTTAFSHYSAKIAIRFDCDSKTEVLCNCSFITICVLLLLMCALLFTAVYRFEVKYFCVDNNCHLLRSRYSTKNS